MPSFMVSTSSCTTAVALRQRQLENTPEQEQLKWEQEQLDWKQKLAQRSQRLQQDPAYRGKMELLAQRKLEDAREAAFQQLFDIRLIPIFGPCTLPCIWVHKQFWEWEKGAKEQLKELRESERLDLARRSNDGFISKGMGWFFGRRWF